MTEDREVTLVWPKGLQVPTLRVPAGYTIRPLQDPQDEDPWISIHRQAVPHFAEDDLRQWLARYRGLALPDGILIASESTTGVPVATAGSLSDPGGMAGVGQLGWVATIPSHRQRGLASWLSAMATERLLSDGFVHLFVGTGTDMMPAIRVYRALGYVPCVDDDAHRSKWEMVSRQTGLVFEPERWPTREQYLST